MFCDAFEEQLSDGRDIRLFGKSAVEAGVFELFFFGGGPAANFGFGDFAAANGFVVFSIAAEVEFAVQQQLFAFVQQSYVMVREFDIVAELFAQFGSFSQRLSGLHFVPLCIGTGFESGPDAFVQEERASLAYQTADSGEFQDAFLGCAESVDELGVAFHAEREVAGQAVDGEVVFAAFAVVGEWIADVVLLKNFEAWSGAAEAGNFAGEVWEQVIAGWHGKALAVAVGSFGCDSIGDRAHACFVEYVVGQEGGRAQQSAASQLFDERCHGSSGSCGGGGVGE